MKKVLGRAVLVLLISSSLHAGPLTPADMALFDASPEDTHAAAVAMRAAGFTSLKQIATQGIGDNIVPYLNNTSGQSYTNTTALQTIMGDNWTSGIIGGYTPAGYSTSLYHQIANASGSVFADLGYAPTNIKDKINTGLFVDLGSSGSASARMGAIFGALEDKAGSANIPTRNTDENLLSWINRISSGGGGDNIVQYLNNTPDQGYSNKTALWTIMGNAETSYGTGYGVIGDYQPTDHADSLYHKIAHTSGSVFADLGYDTESDLRAKIRDGLFGDLGHKTDGASDSASTRASDIKNALGGFTGGGTGNIYNRISITLPPQWTWSPGTPPVPSILRKGILGSLGAFAGTNVSTRISNLLLTLGTRTATDTEATANNITEAISDAIGSYTPTTDYYTGILGKLTDPAPGNGVFGDLGYGIEYGIEPNLRAKIRDGLFAELGGAADTDSASRRASDIQDALGNFTGGGTANIYNMISDVGKPNPTSSQYFGVRGTLNGNNSATVFAAFEAIKDKISNTAGPGKTIGSWDDGDSLWDWLNKIT